MNILITGANGFIGSHLVEEAIAKGFGVFAGVRKNSNTTSLKQFNIQFIELNFEDETQLIHQLAEAKKQFGKFDFVLHNAGATRAKTKDDFNNINNLNTQRLVNALQKANNVPQKFLLVSSLAAFGPSKNMEKAISVDDKMQPISEYGKSKMNVSVYLKNQQIVSYIIAYPTAVYGERDKDFLQLVTLINKGFEPYIGLHKQILSMVYVKDLCCAIIALLQSNVINQSFIISDTNLYNKKQIGEVVKNILNKKTFRVSIPLTPLLFFASINEKIHTIFTNKMPLLTKEKLYEISAANWWCNSQNVWETIGSKPQYNLQQGMQKTIDWYKQNEMIK